VSRTVADRGSAVEAVRDVLTGLWVALMLTQFPLWACRWGSSQTIPPPDATSSSHPGCFDLATTNSAREPPSSLLHSARPLLIYKRAVAGPSGARTRRGAFRGPGPAAMLPGILPREKE